MQQAGLGIGSGWSSDYRDIEGSEPYDKLSAWACSSTWAQELPYFDTVRRLFKPGGLFLNHGITHEQAGWDRNLSTEFINRYVFPDGQLDNISNIQRFMEEAKFEITDVQALRAHYALTLRAWVEQLERRHSRALEYVNEATYRVWRLYMAACALEFESATSASIRCWRVSAAPQHARMPLTRRHLYLRPAKESSVASQVRPPFQIRSAALQPAFRRAARPRIGKAWSRRRLISGLSGGNFSPGTNWRTGWRRRRRSIDAWPARDLTGMASALQAAQRSVMSRSI